MTAIISLMLFSLVLFVGDSRFVNAGDNAWTTNGPYGGPQPILFHPKNSNLIFSAGSSGFFVSTNAGKSWLEKDNPVDSRSFSIVRIHAAAPDVLIQASVYLGSSTLYVFKSSNQGLSWQQISVTALEPFYFYAELRAFEMDPKDPLIMFAYVDGLGIYKSNDGGMTWIRKSVGLPPAPYIGASSLVIDPSSSSKIYLTGRDKRKRTGDVVYISTNGAITWKRSPSTPDSAQGDTLTLAIDPKRPQILYAGGTSPFYKTSYLYKSVNAGKTWSNLNCLCRGVASIAIDPNETDKFYLVTWDTEWTTTLLKTNDGGSTLNKLKLPFDLRLSHGFQRAQALNIQPLHSALIFIITPTDLLRSINAGKTWMSDNHGIDNIQIFNMASIVQRPSRIVVTGGPFTSGEGNVYQTTNSGQNWSTLFHATSTFAAESIESNPWMPGILAMRSINTNGPNFALSTNGGKSWSFSTAFNGNVAFDPKDPKVIYVASAKSVDQGKNWQLFNLPIGNVPTLIRAADRTTPVLYLVTLRELPGGRDKLYRSYDQGKTWKFVADLGRRLGYVYGCPRCLVVDPLNSRILYAFGSNGVFKSFDSGSNWSPKNSGLPQPDTQVLTLAIDPKNNQRIIANALDGLYVSTDGSENWTRFPTNGLENAQDLSSLLFDPSNPKRIFAGMGKGVFEYDQP